jgi:hypothetical protein
MGTMVLGLVASRVAGRWLIAEVFGARRRCPAMRPVRRGMVARDGHYARENVGENVVLSRDVSNVGSELYYEVEMIELSR